MIKKTTEEIKYITIKASSIEDTVKFFPENNPNMEYFRKCWHVCARDHRRYREEIQGEGRSEEIVYTASGKDIEKTAEDYNFWRYMVAVLFFDVEKGNKYFHSNDKPADFSGFLWLTASYRILVNECEEENTWEDNCGVSGWLSLEMIAPMSVIHSYNPLLKPKKELIELHLNGGLLLDLNHLDEKPAECIAI